MKLLVINGPNLNLLGLREPAIYGSQNYESLLTLVRAACDAEGIEVGFAQSNHEGAIVDAIRSTLERTPPELSAAIINNGIMLTGGGAQLHGLTEYLSEELKVEVTVSPDPVNCVALGTAMSLGINDKLETGFMDATPRIGRR